ncbi:MAG: hypothetical protein OXG07_06770, partial [Anaerolineaceae bacterium]|nr:hypothetical protein [Anaerolineaceae bacterium]
APWKDERTGCEIEVTSKRQLFDLNILLAGNKRDEIKVEIFRPGEGNPLQESGRSESQFSETDIPYTLLYFHELNVDEGVFRLKTDLEGHTRVVGWHQDREDVHTILVFCDDDSSAQHSSATPPPELTEELYLDERTGCEVGVAEKDTNEHLVLVLMGDEREQVLAKVIRPGENAPTDWSDRQADVLEQIVEQPHVLQIYHLDPTWPNGSHFLELELGGRTNRFSWDVPSSTDGQLIFVYCNSSAGPATMPTPLSSVEVTTVQELTAALTIDGATGCAVAVPGLGMNDDLNIFRFGERRQEIEIDVYRPGESIPLRVSAEITNFNSSMVNAVGPHILQLYRVTGAWPYGLYHLELTLDGKIGRMAWRREPGYEYSVFVLCD